MKTALEFAVNGADVSRYHTTYTLFNETVGHHSHQVAIICKLLDPDASANLLLAALVHDISEHITGDIPSPAKKEYGIGEQVTHLEEHLMTQAGWEIEPLTLKEKRTLKMADIAQGAIFCAREVNRGNKALLSIYHKYIGYAEAYVLQGREVELFNIIKGYIDESK
ncbi:HD domain containing protein [uncultured Caudovirales phage]|uniref:HD domain containing protein n=1 Tax=uncultured Caudovirales phage TaxID=2100421 RepID=A0A6J5LH45_9CAUD|nr:HD domain containing protein [uncultured Caudovirales phage]